MADQKWGYEGQGKPFDIELNRKVLIGSLIAIIVISLGGLLVGRGVFAFLLNDLENSDPPPPARVEARERRLPPQPWLQDNPEADLAEMRTADREALDSYHWEDESAGLVRVPVERAMEMILEQGLPDWPEIDANGEPVEPQPGGGQ